MNRINLVGILATVLFLFSMNLVGCAPIDDEQSVSEENSLDADDIDISPELIWEILSYFGGHMDQFT